jgi:hypothetical protein
VDELGAQLVNPLLEFADLEAESNGYDSTKLEPDEAIKDEQEWKGDSGRSGRPPAVPHEG